MARQARACRVLRACEDKYAGPKRLSTSASVVATAASVRGGRRQDAQERQRRAPGAVGCVRAGQVQVARGG